MFPLVAKQVPMRGMLHTRSSETTGEVSARGCVMICVRHRIGTATDTLFLSRSFSSSTVIVNSSAPSSPGLVVATSTLKLALRLAVSFVEVERYECLRRGFPIELESN